MITRYWAVCFGCTYDIVIREGYDFPYDEHYARARVAGPFSSFERAKRQIRKWIRVERDNLTAQLAKINAMKADEVKHGHDT